MKIIDKKDYFSNIYISYSMHAATVKNRYGIYTYEIASVRMYYGHTMFYKTNVNAKKFRLLKVKLAAKKYARFIGSNVILIPIEFRDVFFELFFDILNVRNKDKILARFIKLYHSKENKAWREKYAIKEY